jgi:hypothetical protein
MLDYKITKWGSRTAVMVAELPVATQHQQNGKELAFSILAGCLLPDEAALLACDFDTEILSKASKGFHFTSEELKEWASYKLAEIATGEMGRTELSKTLARLPGLRSRL